MTREEQIEQAWFCKACLSEHCYDEKSFKEAAKWADETMIDKAEKWLENFLEKTIQKPSVHDGYTSETIDLVEVKRRRLIEEVLYDFKKAMEE